jgi:pimeloyl-ACP methyl ester carboxylesterase
MKTAYRAAWFLFLLLCTAAAVFYYDPLWVHDEQVDYRLWRAGVHSRYITADGHRIHYFEAGSSGTSLVLVHGLGDRAESWAPLLPSLAAAGFHVYAPDLLGYGRSDKPNLTYSISLEEMTVLDFMHVVGVTRADLDGWSMGGWVAAKLAIDHPDAVDRLVLDDSAGIRFQPSFPRGLFIPRDEAGLHLLMQFLSPRPQAMPHFVARAALRRLARGSRAVESSMDSMESGADLIDTRLGTITQPTLIVWGSEDRLLPISMGEGMHHDIPNSVLATVTGCGHLAPSECAPAVLDATISFLKANPPMPRGEETLPGFPTETPRKAPQFTR